MRKLNAAQEKYANLVVRGVPLVDAYSQCWDASKMSRNALSVEANRRLNHAGISARINELKAIAVKETCVTVESLLAEFEEARELAIAMQNPAAMVSASMGKAKITGLDKRVIELQSKEELTPWDDIGSQ